MPRRKDPVEKADIRFTTTKRVREYLEDLVDTGLYGMNAMEAAERLLANALDELVRAKTISRRPPLRRRR